MKEEKLVCIFSGSPMDAEILKQILEDNGIVANMKNQLMSSIAPYQISAGAVDPSDVEVFERDRKEALLLVDEFYKSAK